MFFRKCNETWRRLQAMQATQEKNSFRRSICQKPFEPFGQIDGRALVDLVGTGDQARVCRKLCQQPERLLCAELLIAFRHKDRILAAQIRRQRFRRVKKRRSCDLKPLRIFVAKLRSSAPKRRLWLTIPTRCPGESFTIGATLDACRRRAIFATFSACPVIPASCFACSVVVIITSICCASRPGVLLHLLEQQGMQLDTVHMLELLFELRKHLGVAFDQRDLQLGLLRTEAAQLVRKELFHFMDADPHLVQLLQQRIDLLLCRLPAIGCPGGSRRNCRARVF